MKSSVLALHPAYREIACCLPNLDNTNETVGDACVSPGEGNIFQSPQL